MKRIERIRYSNPIRVQFHGGWDWNTKCNYFIKVKKIILYLIRRNQLVFF